MSGKLTCKQLVMLITEYVEGALSARERASFDEHLMKCDGCSEYLRQLRTTIGIVGRLREDDLASPARDALLAAFRDWKSRTA